ncbi:hypothetical protein BVC80_4693g3 [Macleaya cordata]|uniref:Retrotransposon Copia-like N-terminal domain-containing protein n=1 Tax=Macleaya cordata TaxID=56857 RepID=A0A200QY37_MACCD|nr:hypothetical protein BVC80_4693g3 [Macleaya cordata]
MATESTPSPSDTSSPAASNPSSPSIPPLNYLIQAISIKLDSENFLVWQKQVDPLLESQELFDYVDPKSSPPPSHVLESSSNLIIPNPAYQHWKKVDKALITFLQATFTSTLLAQTPKFQSSRELYRYLESTFASQVTARQHHLQLQLQTIQKGSLTISEYIAKIKSIADALANTPAPVSDSKLVHDTLRGLGSDYDPFVTAIETRDTLPSFAQLHPLLLNHEMRLLHSHSASNDNNSAAFMTLFVDLVPIMIPLSQQLRPATLSHLLLNFILFY